MRRPVGVLFAGVMVLVSAGCSSSAPAATTGTPSTTAAPTTAAPTTTETTPPMTIPDVTISGPVTGGKGAVVLGPGGIDLSTIGYVQDEYFVSGTASTLSATDPSAPFTTRIVVRRPKDVATASGRVAVEWLNVTAGFDTAPDWTSAHVEFAREHWIWVGVSAQEVGIVGRDGALVPLALKLADPDRYASARRRPRAAGAEAGRPRSLRVAVAPG